MFYAFTLVQADGVDFQNSRACQMEWLKSQGFTTVEYYMVTRDTVEDEVAKFSSKISLVFAVATGLLASIVTAVKLSAPETYLTLREGE